MVRTPVKSIFALAALLATSISAAAADLPAAMPIKAPPPAIFTWTGFYLGGGGGYGMWDADTYAVLDPTFGPIGPFAPGAQLTQTTNNSGKGWFGKVTAGYDYQFNSSWVIGAFADVDFASISGTLNTGMATNFFNALGGTEKMTGAWAVGGRVGWLVTPSILTYANGGFTQAKFRGFAVDNLAASPFLGPSFSTGFSVSSHTYNGWFLGTGVETTVPFLGRGWFVRSEYRFAQYDSATLPVLTQAGTIAGVGGLPVDVKLRPVVQTVFGELTYKFDWGR